MAIPAQVMRERCSECLFTPERIVDSQRMAEVLRSCRDDGAHFICHRATIHDGSDVWCRGFFGFTPRERLANTTRGEAHDPA
jgi:hypothetical protein